MSHQQLRIQLGRLFRDAVHAHKAAFPATAGKNPDWPIWFADYLQEPLEKALETEFSKSQLIYCLMNTDFDHTALAPDTGWVEFFVAEFIEHYAPSDTASKDKLALYTMAGCPYCVSVIRTISHLGLDVEMRDIRLNRGWLDELINARGRATVPVLWIQSPDGTVRWMPESMDIVHYLQYTYG